MTRAGVRHDNTEIVIAGPTRNPVPSEIVIAGSTRNPVPSVFPGCRIGVRHDKKGGPA